MVWQFTDALDEVDTGRGPNLLTGDYQAQNPGWVLDGNTWSGEGSLHLHEGDPYTGPITTSDTTHVVTADVMASSEVTVTWAVHLGTSDGDVTLGPWSETIPAGAWVTVWRECRTPPGTLGGSPTLTVTGPVQVRAPRSSLIMDQTVVRQVVVGDPDGARVELAEAGLVAYDAMGRETARIAGEGGEFVGGEFRTSDNLPGQVLLSDTAADGGPGLQVTPSGAGSYETLPWIGPRNGGISVDGGKDGAGNRSYAFVSPRMVNLQANRDGKEAGSVYISENLVSLSRYGDRGEMGEIAAFPGFVSVGYEYDGVERGLAIDQSGVWVHTNRDGAKKSYNLEETAQDSGWQPITLESGITGNSSPSWRNKGGVIYFQGLVNATWVQGWNTIATGLDAIAPAHEQRAIVPVGGTDKPLLRMVLGTLRVYVPVAGGQGIQLSSLIYPLG